MSKSTFDQPKPKPKYNLKYLLGAGIVLVAIIGLIAFGLTQTSKWALEVSDLKAKGASAVGQGARVTGKLEANSIHKDIKGNQIAFVLTDGTSQLPVSYTGVVPDTFDKAIEVVAEGKLNQDGTFAATTLLAKCPSKYDAASDQPSDYQWYNGDQIQNVQGPTAQ